MYSIKAVEWSYIQHFLEAVQHRSWVLDSLNLQPIYVMISFCVIFVCVSLCFCSSSPHSIPPLQFLLEAWLPLSHPLPGVQLTKHICSSSSSHGSHKSLVSTPHWHRMILFRLVELCVSTWSNLTWLVFVVNLFLESNIFRASCLFQLSFEFCICFLLRIFFFVLFCLIWREVRLFHWNNFLF